VFETLQPRDRDPMLNFDDRDLVTLAEGSGFERVRLTLEVETEPPEPIPWDAYVDVAWNPKIPTLREVIEQVLSRDEQARYALRPILDRGART
jgi:arsenite methyltransferase